MSSEYEGETLTEAVKNEHLAHAVHIFLDKAPHVAFQAGCGYLFSRFPELRSFSWQQGTFVDAHTNSPMFIVACGLPDINEGSRSLGTRRVRSRRCSGGRSGTFCRRWTPSTRRRTRTKAGPG